MTREEELTSIQAALSTLREELEDDAAARAETNAKLALQTKALNAVREDLPNFVRRDRFHAVVAALVVAGLLVAAFVLWARAERQREQKQESVRSAARAYANCEAVNRAFHGVDVGYTFLAQLSIGNVPLDAPDREERLERIDRAHQALRQGLQRTDCSGHLDGLDERDAAEVRSESSVKLPLLPLPPPPLR